MADIIHLTGGDHEEVQRLLPWYANGRLDPPERGKVEAHLAACPQCLEDLRFHRRLKQEVPRLPLDVEAGWERLRRQLEQEDPRPPETGWRAWSRRFGAHWSWGRLGALAAAALIGAGLAVGLRLPHDTAAYHTLSSPNPAPSGDAVVLFRPEATARQIQQDLEESGARVVDGPTTAGAFVLLVPPEHRAEVLGRLRRRPEVLLAQPLGPAENRP